MKRINPNYFTWSKWRNGSIIDFGFPCKEYNILLNKEILKHFAVGWCDASRIPCRQKINHKAIMYLYKKNLFWSHLTNKEFNLIF